MLSFLRRAIAMVTVAGVASLGVAIAFAGCSSGPSNCVSFCIESENCSGQSGGGKTPEQLEQSCESLCKTEEGLAAASNCGALFDDVLDCSSGLSNACEATTCGGDTNEPPAKCTQPCKKETLAFTNCLTKFCEDSKNRSACSQF